MTWTEAVNEDAVFDECTSTGVRYTASRHTGTAFTNYTLKRCTLFNTGSSTANRSAACSGSTPTRCP
ncbi:hypothetical protein B4N89_05495 [Embleya scabrispora]|uniref:Uncharacterized protein n=1 Tax=Embleya scabrispora TaxID=159449 RepID=A0A1T3NUL2_9ACTN|nr:hypothetical protein B4N89_05495 [Embleya scabrispora]